MSIKRIQILSNAEDDLCEGRKFYDKQGGNIGDYFWDSLLSDMESLVIFAGIHRREFGFYRMLSKRFPYAIYYDVNGDVVSVVAVLPIRRDPMWVKAKMGVRS
ncbi:Type II toxin-antitoxin system RelE/ParE family toxin [Gammaproteobacteria bacterium]